MSSCIDVFYSPRMNSHNSVALKSSEKSIISRNPDTHRSLAVDRSMKLKIDNQSSLPSFRENRYKANCFSSIKDIIRYPYQDTFQKPKRRLSKSKASVLQNGLKDYSISSRTRRNNFDKSENTLGLSASEYDNPKGSYSFSSKIVNPYKTGIARHKCKF